MSKSWDTAGNPYLAELVAKSLVAPPRTEYWRRYERAFQPNWFQERERCVREYAWAIPCREAVDAVAELSPLVEVGAGTGYWKMLLEQVGAVVDAFDKAPPVKQWSEVRKGDPRVLRSYPHATLFLCWPLYDKPMASRCLKFYKGGCVAYIGEQNGGCCGDDKFHELLERDFEVVREVEIPQWYGIHDCLGIWRRKKE